MNHTPKQLKYNSCPTGACPKVPHDGNCGCKCHTSKQCEHEWGKSEYKCNFATGEHQHCFKCQVVRKTPAQEPKQENYIGDFTWVKEFDKIKFRKDRFEELMPKDLMVKDSKFNSSEYVEIIVCYYYGFVPILKRDPEEQKRVIATFEATDKIKEIIELLREGRLSVEPQRFLLDNKAVQKLIRNVPVF